MNLLNNVTTAILATAAIALMETPADAGKDIHINVQLAETCVHNVCTDIGDDNLKAVQEYYAEHNIHLNFIKSEIHYQEDAVITMEGEINGNAGLLGTMFWINRQMPRVNEEIDIRWMNIRLNGLDGRLLGVGASMTKSMITNSLISNYEDQSIVQYVIKHELGHVMCLPHTEKKENLMRDTLHFDDGDKLTGSQIKTIRKCFR